MITQMNRKEAVRVMRTHRKTGCQLGILGAPNIQSIQNVYGEYAPFKKIDTVDQLLEELVKVKVAAHQQTNYNRVKLEILGYRQLW